MIPISGIVFVLTIFTVFYSSPSLVRQDSIPDVLPTETEVSVSTQVYIVCILVSFIGSRCI